jgi:hypothetical protein
MCTLAAAFSILGAMKEQYSVGFRCSGIRRCVAGLVISDVYYEVRCFETRGLLTF